MLKTNMNLLNSLLWTLREMTNLIKMIKNHVDDVKCSSWRHPLIPCGELDVLQLLENNKDSDRYTYVLELTLDRIIYTLNLMVKYMETNDSTLAKFKPGKNVERPNNLSVPSILCMLWDRIRVQTDSVVSHRNETILRNPIEAFRTSSSTQSDENVLLTCPTCELAQQLVTQIVLKMETLLAGDTSLPSQLLQQRQLMRTNLINESNWSAMGIWVSAILKDLSAMCDETLRYKADNRKLRSRIDNGESSFMAKVKKQEEELNLLQKISNEKEQKLKSLEADLKVIKERKQKQKKEIMCQVSELKTKNSELAKQLVDSEASKRTLEEQLYQLMKREKAEQERNMEWKVKMEQEVGKGESLREELKLTKTEMVARAEEAKAREAGLEETIKNLTKTLMDQKDENSKLKNSLDEKQKEIERYSRILLEAFPDISEDNKSKYKGTGNPEIDMRHQIQANNLRIAHLTSHNEHLSETIRRIESHRK